jgi:hypothetical protein
MRRLRAPRFLPGRRSRVIRIRPRLEDGAATTLHVAWYQRDAYFPRVVALERPVQLAQWCREQGFSHAVVGGFFARPQYAPLGQLQTGGEVRPSLPFDAPWSAVRACVHITGGEAQIAWRDQLPADVEGDLLQAGPLLVRDGRPVVSDGEDPEGFSAGARQFDSDITAGRYPRAALAVAGDSLIAVACDGRTSRDSGMTLRELADTLVGLGATDALNLDGGGSASLVHHGRLCNRPRDENGTDLLGGRQIVTAIVFEPR